MEAKKADHFASSGKKVEHFADLSKTMERKMRGNEKEICVVEKQDRLQGSAF